MRMLIRAVAWIILIGGPVLNLTRFVPIFYTRAANSPGTGAWVGFTIETAVQILLAGIYAIAVGGGLLLLLDIDQRLRTSPRKPVGDC